MAFKGAGSAARDGDPELSPGYLDPVVTNPELYRLVFENDAVRVLEYRDRPGDQTTPHDHPDSVMVTLSTFRRRLVSADRDVEVEMEAGLARWLPAQRHAGHNTGDVDTHVLFVELRAEPTNEPSGVSPMPLGPEPPAR